MILTVTLNPALDKTVEISHFQIGSVNRISTVRLDAGGKGINVSKTLKSLGGNSKAIGILGGRNGRFIKDFLDRERIENEFLFIGGETRTNLKILDPAEKTNTDINEPGPVITGDQLEKAEDILKKNVNGSTIVVFSGSVPKGVDSFVYGRWIRLVRSLGGRSILDADGELLKNGIEQGPDLIKPNLHELEGLFNTEIRGLHEAERLGRSLLHDYGIAMAVVSLGEAGALFISRECSIHAKPVKVDVRSTVGAGDAMVAALAYSMDWGYSLDKSVRLSMAAGIAGVMTQGSEASDNDVIARLEQEIRYDFI